jgi:hypothetical protein
MERWGVVTRAEFVVGTIAGLRAALITSPTWCSRTTLIGIV